MKTLLAAFALVTMTTVSFAAGQDRPLDNFEDPSWGFSKIEIMQARFTQQAILNSICVVMTGKSIVGTPGFATYALPRLLFAAPHNLSNERAIEIYDQVFDQMTYSFGDPLAVPKTEWIRTCDEYRAKLSPVIIDFIKRLDKK